MFGYILDTITRVSYVEPYCWLRKGGVDFHRLSRVVVAVTMLLDQVILPAAALNLACWVEAPRANTQTLNPESYSHV